ncbi:MAG: biopolymer transporter ExbD [Bdellovibrionaceae bacterium]|nr:biopolymer transporter ExbD [Bdellovibrionales bacterium]MCB9083080.1 biopolymer transporter ExbD [Pseudobdellovibrionaceae bacterium]
MKFGALKTEMMNSPIENQAVVRPKKGMFRRSLVASLVLTSLVDAFSILVIYLLVNTSAATEALDINKEMKLPLASESEVLQAGLVVKIENNRYFLNEQEVGIGTLGDALEKAQQELEAQGDERSGKVIIQGDENLTYDSLNPVITACAQTQIKKIKFAVFPEEKGS